MDDAPRERRIAQARTILNHTAFKAKSNEERQRIVTTMVDKGLSLDDLQMILSTQKETARRAKPLIADRQNFALLDKGPLTVILLNLPPRDVLSICQTDQNYAYVCDDPRIFEQLLDAHYPDALYTDNPHRQYVALTEGIETIYAIDYKMNLPKSILRGEKPLQLGKPRRPEDIPGWSLHTVHPDLVTDFLRNEIFLGWIAPDQRQELEVLRRSVWDPNRKNESARVVELRMPFTDFLDPLFKDFVREYRQKGLESITQIPRVRDALLKYGRENALGYLAESMEMGSQIEIVLHAGRPKKYEGSLHKRAVFTVKGLPIPEGTTASSLVMDSTWSKTVDVSKSKERLVAKFLKEDFENIQKYIFDHFERYITYRPDLRKLEYVPNEARMKTIYFKEWLNKNYPGLTALTKEGIRDYLLKHGGTKIADFHFLPMTF